MPEEVNRIIVDHLSTYLFPPTLTARGNLSNEGLTKGVFVAGNTIVDALKESLNIAKKNSNILNELDLTPKKYILVTAHRQENVDNKKRLSNIFFALSNVANFLACELFFRPILGL
jgi:UDP-N-acetylglucosamine 2-epimerase (non-hydrolysing)